MQQEPDGGSFLVKSGLKSPRRVLEGCLISQVSSPFLLCVVEPNLRRRC